MKTLKPEVKKNAEKKVIDRSKLGRRSRNKGASYERTVAQKFKDFFKIDLVRTPQSGGFAKKSVKADEFRGDIVSADKDIELNIHIECKNAKTWSLPAWLKQAQEDCPKGKKPVVIMHKHNSGENYVVLKLEDFFEIAQSEKLFKRKDKE